MSPPLPEDDLFNSEAQRSLRSVVAKTVQNISDSSTGHPNDDLTLEEIRSIASQDPAYARLLQSVANGFPSHQYSLHNDLLPYWKLRDALYTDGDLVLYGSRVVVPTAIRRKVLASLHASHRGIEATKRRAAQTVYWPGINADITNTVRACEPCQVMQPSQQKEPILCDDKSSRPFQSASADFFSAAGKFFMVYVDRLSNWPVVVKCGNDTTTSATIRHFCHIFRDLGVPVRLRTDGGPQFTSQAFEEFSQRWGV